MHVEQEMSSEENLINKLSKEFAGQGASGQAAAAAGSLRPRTLVLLKASYTSTSRSHTLVKESYTLRPQTLVA